MSFVTHSPSVAVPCDESVQVPEATTVLSPVGGHDSMRQVPLEPESKKKPWMWKTQTLGSFSRSGGSLWLFASWILMVPLLPAEFGWADANGTPPSNAHVAMRRTPSHANRRDVVRCATVPVIGRWTSPVP
jgi:hypothetical protein